MASKLVVLRFEGTETAANMFSLVQDMEKRGIIELEDAAIAQREERGEMNYQSGVPTMKGDAAQAYITQTKNKRGRRAATFGTVGLLAGLVVGLPVAALAIGAFAGGMRDKGINDKFIQQVTDGLTPGSSALFLLVSKADTDAVIKEFEGHKATILSTDISPETEAKLKAAVS